MATVTGKGLWCFANPWEEEQQFRRLRKCIELSHDFWAYQKLSAIYHQNEQFEECLAVIDDYLAQPSRGLKIARETGAGYTKILGELKKLGINGVSRSTVVNILKEQGLDPGPKRGEGAWDGFVKRHAETLWATDSFSKKVWTKSGLVEFFVLFFINVATRRVHIAAMTPLSNSVWMAQQARKKSTQRSTIA
ncbi:MAG TPA: hypothetical protein VMV10_05565 [Pirellulales bacterium]|nr:hypothetical protein [Pirellulales bacterium]